MTTDQIILFVLFGAVFALLLWGRFRYDLVAFAALMAGVVLGVVPSENAFDGFGHPATLVVALVLVVSAGLVRSGAVLLITRTLVDASRGLGRHIALMGAIGGVLSAFMNNVAALALLMPVDIQTARKAGRMPGLSLMPLSFATILGGMVTLIGTPPNIIIASIREDALGAPFRMFDFAPVGGVAAIAGLAFVALIGWRLIPDRADATLQAEDIAPYIAELTVPEDSKQIGKRVLDLYETAEKSDVAILGLIRDGKRRYGQSRTVKLAANDALVIEATPEALDEFRSTLDLHVADAAREERLNADGEGVEIIEVVVPSDSRMNGRTAQAIGLTWRQRTVLLGISRQGRKITSQLRKTQLKAGDILLLLVPRDTAAHVTDWLGVLPLADRGLAVTDNGKVWLAIGLFGAAVAAASLGLIYLPIALGLVVVAYVLTRIVPLSELYSHIEWPVVVLLGSMIPLGAALEASGGTELIAGALVGLTEGFPAWIVLTVLMIVTMTLSDVLNNTATTIVAAPVGIQMAQTLGVSPDPFLMAVAVAASSAFLTPIGHKNNTLILGPGGYSFGDYWRMGLPLEIIVVAVSIPAILLFWPL
ncbi:MULTISPECIES: SLC13 family permease [unclassified Sulfitobacter]|uniref:SLC13 family permease n=1 Tax=unclassified Sulfitobacter TaxID=196795 RepID=UPI0007C209EE|nr:MULTISPECIES: SLC13 family permease [unclassified Sulfitobacter]KZX98738.1 potassium transporter TrkA [Sulfitobacter sp. HI0023]KZY23412.1 potassium transporter TrkA [Sulfitobacter sp. HI0040]KZZ68111.1 potassium transporter TrkA [Sulfitobacter sp. HI0129]